MKDLQNHARRNSIGMSHEDILHVFGPHATDAQATGIAGLDRIKAITESNFCGQASQCSHGIVIWGLFVLDRDTVFDVVLPK